MRLCLSGFGNVGRHFVRLVAERRGEIRQRYGIALELTAVASSSGGILSPEPLDLEQLLGLGRDPGWAARYPAYGRADLSGSAVIAAAEADILVEATPSDVRTGEPGLTHLRTALGRGMSVATLAKGALVLDYGGLMALARRHGAAIRFSGATAAALPTADVAAHCLAGADILAIQGILNGTTNYILTRMTEDGLTYAAALQEARDRGIAEPDPAQDVEGWDAAAKMVILANAVWDAGITLDQAAVTGITGVTPDQIRIAAGRGEVIKLVAAGRPLPGGGAAVSVAPVALPRDRILAGVNGTTKAVRFETDTMGDLTVIGGRSDPRAAAAAALKDVIHLAGREGA